MTNSSANPFEALFVSCTLFCYDVPVKTQQVTADFLSFQAGFGATSSGASIRAKFVDKEANQKYSNIWSMVGEERHAAIAAGYGAVIRREELTF